ncbi:MAG: alpha/beta fold hydrolase [Oscillospiraceae bacterium]|nr:alpha/beta fold hydrolase [Oscillospiraceae bacterium]
MKKAYKRILAGVSALAVLTVAGGSIATAVIMQKRFDRAAYPDRKLSAYYLYEDFAGRYPRENVQFTSGGNTLQGYFYGMENDGPLLVFAHGIGTGHESYLNQLLWFVDRGWRVFAYDATGTCTSEGKGTKGLVQSVLDLDNALTFIEQDSRFSGVPVCVMGHSWGGYAAAAILEYDHKIAASASISGYAYPVEMLDKGAEDMLGSVLGTLFHPFAWGYNQIVFGKDAGRNAVDAANSSTTPLYVTHGELDELIPYDSIGIYGHRGEITNPNAEFHTVSGKYAGHTKLIYSDASNDYAAEFNEGYAKIAEQYPDGVPDDVRAAELAKADTGIVNQPNEALLSEIETFFLKHLPS